ncbi:MAG: hypothetical protein KGJ86_21365 [Chloroflexota bacterium]|nr:hypothetical protein [Chloroflexota bacterium]
MSLMTLDPTGVKQVEINSMAPRPRTLNGARVGLLYNVKPNGKELLAAMGGLLEERYGVSVVGAFATSAPMLSSKEQLEELASQCDLVLTGLGD